MPLRVVNASLERLLIAAEHDPVLVKQFSRVTNFLDPPARLLRPAVIRRVVGGNLRRRREEPTVVPDLSSPPREEVIP
jgi:hypothetical protein